MNYVCDSLEKTNKAGYTCFPVPHEQVKDKSKGFEELHASRVGKKQAGELQVLFLCGEEPMNDLKVMLEAWDQAGEHLGGGIRKGNFQAAVESLSRAVMASKSIAAASNSFLKLCLSSSTSSISTPVDVAESEGAHA